LPCPDNPNKLNVAQMKLSKQIEEKIKIKALELLAKGRTDWDQRHTLCAVDWMRKLIAVEGGDERVLIPAIYFHDTGYEELEKGYSYDDVLTAKPKHAEISEMHAKKYLPKLKYFTPQEIKRITYLVKNHDIHNNITEHDRQLIFEADGLAQVDWQNCPTNFDKKSCLKFMDDAVKNERLPFLKTRFGKKTYKKLLASAKKYLSEMK
jgi:hypothetical protein